MSKIIRMIFFVLVIRPLLTLFVGIRVLGKDNIPHHYPFIIAANHASHLDTVALMSLFSLKDLSRIRPVAAADYFCRNKLTAIISHLLFNILPIERKHVGRDHNPLHDMSAALDRGESLIVFPEGTRSSSGEMGPFHAGVAHIVKEHPHVPVIPVYLSNMGRALPKGEFILLPLFCEIHIGPPISLGGTKEEIMDTLRNAIHKLKGELSVSK